MAKKFKLDFNKYLGLGGGAIAAKFANKPLANLDPKLRSGAKVAVGIALPMFIKKVPMIEHIGNGIIAAGIGELVGNLVPALAGDEDFETLGAMDYAYMNTEDLLDDPGVQGLADAEEPTLE